MSDKDNRQSVIVTDIHMPFLSMVIFMVKWAIASIPAFIILTVVGAIAWGMFMRFILFSTIEKKTVAGIEVPSVVLTTGEPPTLSDTPHEVRLDRLIELDEHVGRGSALFNGKAVCFGCHGINSDSTTVNNPDVARLHPRPTDLREPSDKSVRQLYLTIKYGINNTAMVPVQESTGLRDVEMWDILSFVLALQGTPLPYHEMVHRATRMDEADIAIFTKCSEQTIGDYEAAQACEEHLIKRYRDLVVGRPPDIPRARYEEIQAGCKQRFGKNLDDLARCYGVEYGITRQRMR